MKKIFLTFLIICLSVTVNEAQKRPRQGNNAKPMQRIEQLEKLKLIEILNLNEETAVRFFSRRHDHQMKMRDLLDRRDQAINDLENDVKNDSQRNDAFFKDQINKMMTLENNISAQRENYIKSLSDLLSPLQISKLLVFESNFRRQVRETLMDRGRGQMNNQ
ncbi:MAG: hypothetical protein CVV24_10605 [Ignavibacteriae bacterium HGW-Ignavibacteriae-3]|nr:MAG: hypothetical protein CVV24_10605 [Ignavibacteriae bacterium HGW-Ignavibacteriae-3]